ncbi:unknown [Clostridium sp. CAG:448]|nr:unknown [Clostridium sp. CAG:448]
MTGFVISGIALFAFLHRAGFLLRSGNDLDKGILNVCHADQTLFTSGGKQGCLIQQVCKIRTGEACGGTRHLAQIDVRFQRFVACMNLQNIFTSPQIRYIDRDLTVKTSRTKERRIQNIRTVGCSHDNDAIVRAETVHFDKQLVQRLFTFIVTAAKTCASVSAYRIDFINEDDGSGGFPCGFKQITDTGRTDTDIHFHKVGAGD